MILKKFIKKTGRKILNAQAISNFKKERKIVRTGKIRVGFIVQYIPAWNKFKSLYDALNSDDRFETVLICVPLEINNNKLEPNIVENGTYNYFIENGYDALNALLGKNKWLNLKEIKLDYIFYPRPYNSLMPKPYISKKVSKYTKICCIMYGMAMTEEILSTSLNQNFFRNVYCYFAESKNTAKKNMENFPKTHSMGLQKTVSYGMPVLAGILKESGAQTHIWDFANNKFKIMWTPRWTTDLKLGGTNFFTHKDVLLNYAKNNSDTAFVFRPHPLALSNFIDTGEMTKLEAYSFEKRCKEEENVLLDKTEDYIATMWYSDALITDISGIIPEYFVTGKPLIYCAANMILTPAAHTRKMLEGCYVVSSNEELLEKIALLKSGNDYLKEKRQMIINELWGSNLFECVHEFVEELYKDR